HAAQRARAPTAPPRQVLDVHRECRRVLLSGLVDVAHGHRLYRVLRSFYTRGKTSRCRLLSSVAKPLGRVRPSTRFPIRNRIGNTRSVSSVLNSRACVPSPVSQTSRPSAFRTCRRKNVWSSSRSSFTSGRIATRGPFTRQ